MVKSESGNGLVPVKFEYAEVYYDTKSADYIATIKIGTKKYAFQQIKD